VIARVVVAAVAVGVVATAGAATTATPGVTAKTILLGSTGPLSGDAAAAGAVLRGADAYFRYVNARGGVNGRRIAFKYYDDAADPATAAENAGRLIQDDQVFAVFSTVGTSGSLAVRPVANAARVPHLFAASGASTLGRDYRRYPYTLGYLPTYLQEGQVYARYVVATVAERLKVGVLYQDDEYGRELLAGLEKGLGRSSGKLVAKVPYEPAAAGVEAEVAQLEASGANTLMLFASGKFATQAYQFASRLGWKPQVYVNEAAATPALMRAAPQAAAEGSVTISYARDPFANDPGAKLAATIVGRYLPGANPRDPSLVEGMASAFTMVDALKRAGPNPTRESLMRAATNLHEADNPFLLPGVVVRTTATSRFPIAQVKLRRWHAARWVPLGGLVSIKR
jgi:branched-chain amino acid transport system substrate-binding protein